LNFEAVLRFICENVSHLASQVSIVAAKFGSIVAECWYFNS